VITIGPQDELNQRLEVQLEPGLAERHVSQLEEMIFEVVQIPLNRLAIESLTGIGDRVVHDLPPTYLEAR